MNWLTLNSTCLLRQRVRVWVAQGTMERPWGGSRLFRTFSPFRLSPFSSLSIFFRSIRERLFFFSVGNVHKRRLPPSVGGLVRLCAVY